MSQQNIIIIVLTSLICAFIITSILFTISGYLCGLYRRNQDQTLKLSAKKPTPVYEDVLPKDHEKPLELKTNIAYAPVQKV